MAFGCLSLACGLSGGLVWQSLQSRVTPYVVEVDRLGEARAVGAAEAGYRPTDAQVAWHLAHFIADIRSVSLDPVLTRSNWLEAYDFTTRRGAQYLDNYARAADPFAGIGERTVSVQVTSVVRASDRSFQVKWAETAYDRGAKAGMSHWTAILTVVQTPPTSADALRKNPLGLYVDAIDWSRELDPAAASSPSPRVVPAEPAEPAATSLPALVPSHTEVLP
jgi:type IV secretion system protein VirB5